VGGHALSELPARGYSLIASVKHHGPSILQGHYTATIRTDAGWMICDDLAAAVMGPFAHDSVILDFEHQAAMLLFYEADDVVVVVGAEAVAAVL
jgi:ubiquitin C-terminal hydrolase